MGRTSSITMPSMVGIVGRDSRAGCRRKSVIFLSVFFCQPLEWRSLW